MGWKERRDFSHVSSQISICCSRFSRHRSNRAYHPLTPFCNVPTKPTGRLSLFEDVSSRRDEKWPLFDQNLRTFFEPIPPFCHPVKQVRKLVGRDLAHLRNLPKGSELLPVVSAVDSRDQGCIAQHDMGKLRVDVGDGLFRGMGFSNPVRTVILDSGCIMAFPIIASIMAISSLTKAPSAAAM